MKAFGSSLREKYCIPGMGTCDGFVESWCLQLFWIKTGVSELTCCLSVERLQNIVSEI